MNSVSEFEPKKIFQILQDQTRFAIFLYLLIYKKLTLKQLSLSINKSKTTIFHPVRKLEALQLIKSEERDEGRKLFTKYFSLNYGTLINKIKLTEDESNIESMKTKNLIISYVMDRMIKFSEERGDILSSTAIKIFPLTLEEFDEKNTPTKDFDSKMVEMINALKQNGLNNSEDTPVTHIYAHVLIPIKNILEWKPRSDSE